MENDKTTIIKFNRKGQETSRIKKDTNPVNRIEEFIVFVTRPAYTYYDEHAGHMCETHLDQEFIADSRIEAIEQGIAWAKNRFEAIMEDCYSNKHAKCFFSSIKISTRQIMRANPDGFIETRSNGTFFEWKCDWPGTLEDYVKGVKRENHQDIHHNPNWALLKKMA